MKKRRTTERVTPEVHQFLSRNGQKGGATIRHLVQLGRKLAQTRGENVERSVEKEMSGKESA